MRALGGTLDLPALLGMRPGGMAGLRLAIEQAGVAVPVVDSSFRLTEPRAVEREQLLAFIPWAEAMGTAYLRVFDGDLNDEAGMALATETLAWWRAERRARRVRVDLAVETHDSLFTAAAIRRLVAAAPSVKILWDSHHTWRHGGENPRETWEALSGHIVHIHVKDSVSRPGPRFPYTYVLPGTGEFPMGALKPILDADFGGAVSLEWEKFWHPDLPPLAEALDSARGRAWW